MAFKADHIRAGTAMSLQVNLSSREISDAYQNVINARGIDWVIFTYEGGTNDLKVQATGDGGLEELEEEFSDGRYDCSIDHPIWRSLIPVSCFII